MRKKFSDLAVRGSRAIRQAGRAQRRPPAGGFALCVFPSGTRSWILRSRVGGRTIKLTIGNAAVMPVAEARAKAENGALKGRAGEDPRLAAAEEKAAGSSAWARWSVTTSSTGGRRPPEAADTRRSQAGPQGAVGPAPPPAGRARSRAPVWRPASSRSRPSAARSPPTAPAHTSRAASPGPCGRASPRPTRSPERKRPGSSAGASASSTWRNFACSGAPPRSRSAITAWSGCSSSSVLDGDEVGAMAWGELSDDLATWVLPAGRTKTGQSRELPLPNRRWDRTGRRGSRVRPPVRPGTASRPGRSPRLASTAGLRGLGRPEHEVVQRSRGAAPAGPPCRPGPSTTSGGRSSPTSTSSPSPRRGSSTRSWGTSASTGAARFERNYNGATLSRSEGPGPAGVGRHLLDGALPWSSPIFRASA